MEAFALSPDAVRVPLPQRLLSDDRLLRLVAAGNPQAFGAVYARYHAPLYAYCRSIVRDPDDAKDALQNTMVKALAALGRGEDRDVPLKPWLFRIAHNESVTLLRRRRPSEPLTDAVSPPVAGVDVQAAARERLGQLVEDLQELPERQRAALIMREVNGLSYEEIAGVLEISPGAARQTVFEARTALAEYGEGREVACESIRRSISDGDGRAMRARRVRAHLRACDACRDFHSTLKVRRRELHLLAPGLSGGTAMALLQGVVGSGVMAGGGAAATGGAGLLGGSASALLASGAAKSVVAIVAVSAVGAGAAHIVAPTHHRAHRPVAASHAIASAAGAHAADPATVDAAAALSGRGFSVLQTGGGAHGHRSVAALAPHVGLDQAAATSTLPGAAALPDVTVPGSGHGHHGQPFSSPYGAGTELPPGPAPLPPGAQYGGGRRPAGVYGGDGATAPPAVDPSAVPQPPGGGYTNWPGSAHHPVQHGPAIPADPSSGSGGYDPSTDPSADPPPDPTAGDPTANDSGAPDPSSGGPVDPTTTGDGGDQPGGGYPSQWPAPTGGGPGQDPAGGGSGSGTGSGGGWHHWTPPPPPAPTGADPSTGGGSGTGG